MEQKIKENKKQSKFTVGMTIAASTLAILTIALGVFGLINGYEAKNNEQFVWLSVISIVIGTVITALSLITFTKLKQSRIVFCWKQIIWALCSFCLLFVGVYGTFLIHQQAGLIWIPICVMINGILLFSYNMCYFLQHSTILSSFTELSETLIKEHENK